MPVSEHDQEGRGGRLLLAPFAMCSHDCVCTATPITRALAGGLVVETSSGVSAFVLAFWLGPGQTLHGGGHHQKPHNIPFVLLGAGLLWVGA